MKRVAIFLAWLTAVASAAAQTAEKPSIVGTWTAEDAEAKTTVVFKTDGTFTRTVVAGGKTTIETGKYTIAGNVILVEPEGEDEVIPVKFKLLNADRLHLTIPDEGAVTLDRADAAKPPVVTGRSVDLWPVEVHGRFGFTDRSGKLVIEATLEGAEHFEDGLARVKKDGKFGFIGPDGRLVIACRYAIASSFGDGLAAACEVGKWGFIDKTGKVVIKPRFDGVREFSEGHAGVRQGEKWGVINTAGEIVVPPRYEFIGDGFHSGLVPVAKVYGANYIFIDKTGKQAFDATYEEAEDFSEGLAEVKIKGKRGFIDTAGKLVIPAKYRTAGSFHGGLAAVVEGDDFGYIDKTGKMVIKPRFTFAFHFRNGLGEIEIYGLAGYCDRTGKLVRDPLAGIRDWADLTRASDSSLVGGTILPIRLPSKDAAQQYLAALRDSRRRPLTFEYVNNDKGLDFYRVTDKNGRQRTCYFKLTDPKADPATAKSPQKLFFEKKQTPKD